MAWKSNLSTALTKLSVLLDDIPDLRVKLQDDIGTLLAQLKEEKTLIVAGEFKAGKSTFINALLGRSELTVDVLPTTAVMTKLTYGSKKRVLGHFQNGTVKEYDTEWLPQLTAEVKGEMAKVRGELAYVELQLPVDRLKTLHIIDSPGLNSSHDEHTEATRSMLDRADILIWVFNYMSIGSQTELEQLDDIRRRQIPIIGLVNGIDSHDDEEESLEDFLVDQQQRLRGKFERLIGVSAREALKAMQEGNEQELHYSGWPQIEELINSVQQDDSLMPSRVFRKMEALLQQLDEYFSNEKNESRIFRLQPLIDSFVSKDYPELVRMREESRKQWHEADTAVTEWLAKYNTILKTPEEIESFTKELGGKPEQRFSGILARYFSFKKLLDSYIGRVESLRKQSEQLKEQWPRISKGGFCRFWKIKKYDGKLAACREQWFELTDLMSDMNRTRKQLKVDVQSLDTLIKQFINRAMDPHYAMMDSLNKGIQEKRKGLNNIYKEINEHTIDRIADMYRKHSALIEALQPIFGSADRVIGSVDSYQRSKYRYENIRVSLPKVQIEQAYNDFKEFLKIPEVWLERIKTGLKGDISAEFVTLTLIPHLPARLDYDSEGLIRNIKKAGIYFALAASALLVVMAVSLSNYYDSNSTRELEALSTRQQPSQQNNVVTSTDQPSITPVQQEPEPVQSQEIIPASAYDPEEIANFIDQMYDYVPAESRTGNFDSAVFFTGEAWLDYERHVSQFYSGVKTQMINRGVNPLVTGQMVAIREEVYEIDTDRLTYQVVFEVTTRQDQSLVISNVSIERLAREPIGVVADVHAMDQFLQDYRDHYFDTLNEDDFRLVSPYLTPDGEAYSELLKYTSSISGRGYKFEHVAFDIRDIKQVGPNAYVANTSERFIAYDYGVNKQADYKREKQYFIRALAEDQFSIDRIVIRDTQKQTHDITKQSDGEGSVVDDFYTE